MGYLLDTHVLLWALDEENHLSSRSKAVISNPESSCSVSIISFFEISIKKKIGKLELSRSVSEYIQELERVGIEVLPISEAALDNYEIIPFIPGHGDPFDRFIIATALSKNLTIISADEKFKNYQDLVEVLW